MQSAHQIIAPHRIVDDELELVVYSPGDAVPYEDAVKYGLVTPEDGEEAKPKRARKAAQDRAKRPSRNTAIQPSEDR